VVDVEAACWVGDPPAGQTNEIIEIGITVVDLATRTRVSKHGIIVRDAWNIGALVVDVLGRGGWRVTTVD
jgi:hypothetical protein